MSADDSELTNLQTAIAALEAQRQALGDAVVNAALVPLYRQVEALRLQHSREQRRLVTVLFCDLVGFTHLAEGLDPEDVREVITTIFQCWSAVLRRHGGVVEKYAGDAVMAVFGLERAQENDPRNAVRAGLELGEETRRLRKELQARYGVDLRLRVGIHTGPVVATLGGGLPGQDFSVVGDTVNLASRLQALAPVNGVLISHDTYRHLRGAFVVQTVEPAAVKGRSQPVKVYVVIARRSRESLETGFGVEGAETPLVGREGELHRLALAFQETAARRKAAILLVMGEAGIGKSRLLAAFSAWLQQEGVRQIFGRASQATRIFPYALLRDLFARLCAIQDSDTAEAAIEKLAAELAHAGVDTGPAGIGDLAALLGYQPASQGSDAPQAQTGAARRQSDLDRARQVHERGTALLVDYLSARAGFGPLVILIEDLHWCDPSSLALLQRLPAALAGRPLLLVCTARPALFEHAPGWGAEPGSAALPGLQHLELSGLPPSAGQDLLDAILAQAGGAPQESEAPPALAERISTLAEGNPYYIEELVKVLVEDGVIVKAGTRWEFQLERLAGLRLPATLTGLLQARLDNLAGGQQQALQSAAVIGRSFWDQAVAYVLEHSPASGVQHNPIEASEAISALARSELIYPVARPAFENTREYQFKHALLRDVAYESLVRRQRALYHGLTAHWLEAETARSGRQNEFAALIAWHYDQANERPAAVAWYQHAAHRVATQYANAEAARYASRALELTPASELQTIWDLLCLRLNANDLLGERQLQLADLDRLPALADALQRDDLRFEALLLRADYAERVTDYTAMLENAQRAYYLAERAGLRRQQAEALLRWGASLWRQADYRGGGEKIQAALQIARQLSDGELEAGCLRQLGAIAWQQSDYTAARQYQLQSLEYYQRIDNKSLMAQIYNGLGNIALHLVQVEAGREAFSKGAELARQSGHLRREADALNGLGLMDDTQGDYASAHQKFEQVANLYFRVGDMDGYGAAMSNLGSTSHSLGDFTAARRSYETALEVQRRSNDREGALITIINLGILSLQSGDYTLARQYCQEALDDSRQLSNLWVEGYALVYMGHLHLQAAGFEYGRVMHLSDLNAAKSGAEHELEAAENCYRHSAELRRELRQHALVQDPQAGLARVALARDRLDEAVLLVEEILAYIAQQGTDGIDEPALVFLTCFAVLGVEEARLPATQGRAAQALEAGYQLLMSRAVKINDPALRRSYLRNIPANAELLRLFRPEESGL
jgi:class 3 adenylate cyclase/tetratricopeptide (TPR) repeat protein